MDEGGGVRVGGMMEEKKFFLKQTHDDFWVYLGTAWKKIKIVKHYFIADS